MGMILYTDLYLSGKQIFEHSYFLEYSKSLKLFTDFRFFLTFPFKIFVQMAVSVLHLYISELS